MSWSEKSLDELGFVRRGKSKHRPRDAEFLYCGAYPFIQTGDVKHAELYITNYSQTYSEAGLAQSKMWPAGTLCITIAANIAETAILGVDACFPDSVIGFVADESKSDARFIKYKFDTIKQRYQQISQGAAQDNLSVEKLLSFKLRVPEVDEQRSIADLLSTYDELIENNRQRMRLLEEAARLLYREWFVRFRFPGHERTPIKGGIPNGWCKTPIGKLLDFHIGGGWGEDESLGNETEPAFVIRGTDIPQVEVGNFGTVQLRYHNPRRLSDRSLRNGDVIFEVSGGSATQAVGRTLLVTDELLRVFPPRVICASFCKVFRVADPELPYFLDCFLRYIRHSGELAVFQKQSASALLNFQFQAFLDRQDVLLPSRVLLREFCGLQKAIVSQQRVLSMQNHKLRAARDLLLPRLMSGEIAV